MLRTIYLTVAATVCLSIAAASRLVAQQAPPAQGDEAQLLAVLQSNASLFDKAKACQQLAVTGTKKSVPVLAQLLADEKLAHYARYGLEPIPDRSVDDALRDAMGKLHGKLLVGVIDSIGMRRDAKAIEGLQAHLGGPDTQVAAAAAFALSRIATDPALEALTNALSQDESRRAAVGQACLTAADTFLKQGKPAKAAALYDKLRAVDLPKQQRVGALYGAIRARGAEGFPLFAELLQADQQARFDVALSAAHQLTGAQVTQALIAALPKLSPVRRALVIHVLADRNDKAALPVVAQAAKTGPLEVRVAATRVLATLGDASVVPVLVAAAIQDDPDLAQAARDSLVGLAGPTVDAALAKLLAGSEGKTRTVVIQLAGLRHMASALPVLVRAADDEDPQVRKAAIGALALTVDLDRLPLLIDRLVKPVKPEDRAEAKEALAKACQRMPDRDACAAKLLERMPAASLEAKRDLLQLLGELGGDRALQGVATAARDPDNALQDAATEVLGKWTSTDVAPVLLELARSENYRYRTRALSGYIRIARQFGNLSPKQRLAMCRTAMEVARRDQDRQQVLNAAGRVATRDALDFVSSYLDNQALKESACAASVAIAGKLVNRYPAAVAKVMPKVAEVTASRERAEQAKTLLRRAENRIRR